MKHEIVLGSGIGVGIAWRLSGNSNGISVMALYTRRATGVCPNYLLCYDE
jgi:uncharacterized membrane-anchored protein YitT (DUF2179 family)